MDKRNYASPAMCKKLVEAGVTISTDCYWHNKGDEIYDDWEVVVRDYWTANDSLPAFNLSELWRELPDNVMMQKEWSSQQTNAWMPSNYNNNVRNINPCDALAELRIWVEDQKEKDK